MKEHISEYISNLSDEEKAEVIELLVSSSKSAEERFLCYYRNIHPEESSKLKEAKVRDAFEEARHALLHFAKTEYDYYDKVTDDYTSEAGESLNIAAMGISEDLTLLLSSLKEDNLKISSELRDEIYKFVILQIDLDDYRFEDDLINISQALCYTADQDLKLAEDISQYSSYSCFQTAVDIYSKYGRLPELVALKRKKAYSSRECLSVINDYMYLGKSDTAFEYAVDVVSNRTDAYIFNDEYTDQICDFVFAQYLNHNNVEYLLENFNPDLPERLLFRILQEAENRHDKKLSIRILSTLIENGRVGNTGSYYIQLKNISSVDAEKAFESVKTKDDGRYLAICMAERKYDEIITAMDDYISQQEKSIEEGYDSYRKYEDIPFDEYAEKLEAAASDEIYRYYFRNAENYIRLSERNNYDTAIRYLEKAWNVNSRYSAGDWNSDISSLLKRYSGKRLLTALIKEAGLLI